MIIAGKAFAEVGRVTVTVVGFLVQQAAKNKIKMANRIRIIL